MQLCRDKVTPLIAIYRIPRIHVGIRDRIDDLPWHAVHDVISEIFGADDAEYPIDLPRHRIPHGAPPRQFWMINPDVDHAVIYGRIAKVGYYRVEHIPIGCLVEIELTVQTRREL